MKLIGLYKNKHKLATPNLSPTHRYRHIVNCKIRLNDFCLSLTQKQQVFYGPDEKKINKITGFDWFTAFHIKLGLHQLKLFLQFCNIKWL